MEFKRSRFERYVFPIIGDMPITTITPSDVKAVADQAVRKKQIALGKKLCSEISTVFRAYPVSSQTY